jgi:hypothetical protein
MNLTKPGLLYTRRFLDWVVGIAAFKIANRGFLFVTLSRSKMGLTKRKAYFRLCTQVVLVVVTKERQL